jgi:hypothetical protein
MVVHGPDPPCYLRVVRDDRAGVPECTQVLAGIEAEAAHVAEGAGRRTAPAGSVRLSCILDDGQPGRRSDPPDGVHVRHLSVQMHDDDGAGARGDRCGQGGRSEQESVRTDIGEARGGTGEDHPLGRGDERVGGDDDLVAGPDPQRP